MRFSRGSNLPIEIPFVFFYSVCQTINVFHKENDIADRTQLNVDFAERIRFFFTSCTSCCYPANGAPRKVIVVVTQLVLNVSELLQLIVSLKATPR